MNKILNGDCLEVLKTLPDESIDCVMTSPPYWALRDYGVEGQLGLEPTFQEYINKLCDIFDEVKRVLKKEGTCWVNMGDTYASNSGKKSDGGNLGNKEALLQKKYRTKMSEVSEKSLCQIPSRFAIEMCNRGWILRNEIIWHKPNCMPSSVKDRFTVDFEKIFFFTKSKKYYFETQYEPHAEVSIKARNAKLNQTTHIGARKSAVNVQLGDIPRGNRFIPEQGRNKRCVWRITTKPYKEAHFATYPEELCETPIKAGCPEFVCKKCGKAREKMYERVGGPPKGSHHKNFDIRVNPQGRPDTETKVYGSDLSKIYAEYGYAENKYIGLTDCGCNAGWESGVVLDPFFGAGTTGLVALKQNKNFIGIELNPEYIKIAEARLELTKTQQTLLYPKEEKQLNLTLPIASGGVL